MAGGIVPAIPAQSNTAAYVARLSRHAKAAAQGEGVVAGMICAFVVAGALMATPIWLRQSRA